MALSRRATIDQALLEAAASEELLAAGSVDESSVVRGVAEG